MNDWHPWSLKKSKSLRPFWSYQLNSTANSAHLAHLPCYVGLSLPRRVYVFTLHFYSELVQSNQFWMNCVQCSCSILSILCLYQNFANVILCLQKSVNLQCDTLGRLDDGPNVDQASDVPSIIFFFNVSCKMLCFSFQFL